MAHHNIFRGGIQKGTVATDSSARKLDEQCKHLTQDVYTQLKKLYPELVVLKKLPQSLIPGGIGGCAPDGGAWMYRGTLIAVFEGKKQQNAGNAIERWFKNNFICRLINPNVSYVTFCIGKGAFMNWSIDDVLLTYGQIVKALNVAHLEGFNQYNPGANSAFLKTDCFTKEEINTIMIEVISERINTLFN